MIMINGVDVTQAALYGFMFGIGLVVGRIWKAIELES